MLARTAGRSLLVAATGAETRPMSLAMLPLGKKTRRETLIIAPKLVLSGNMAFENEHNELRGPRAMGGQGKEKASLGAYKYTSWPPLPPPGK